MLVPLPRAIAFYLPQFHPIPENDEWWGKGFTEWRKVTRARPLFANHYQAHLPADLGFYDLRLPETRTEQAELARAYGIHGFCYYHYWFNSRRILQRPFEEVLTSGEPDFPFCLCWANENWTRRWDGSEKEILLEQMYSKQDDINHFLSLAPALKDPRYIRINGKPLFLIYKISALPDPQETAKTWRYMARQEGIGELYLAYVQSDGTAPVEPATVGMDAAVEFQPSWPGSIPGTRMHPTLRERIKGIIKKESPAKKIHYVYAYDELVSRVLSSPIPPYTRFPCVTPSWDNTARRKWGGVIFHDSTPEKYGRWLRQTISLLPSLALPEPIIFINAWNEWAEGNHLEPDQRWGSRYLEETLKALSVDHT